MTDTVVQLLSSLRPDHVIAPEHGALFIAGMVAGVIVTGCCAGGALLCLKLFFRKHNRRRKIMQHLRLLENNYRLTRNPEQLLCSYNTLLKRVALKFWPASDVASLYGERWLVFLDRSGSSRDFTAGAGRPLGCPWKSQASFSPGRLSLAVRRWIHACIDERG